MTDRLEKIKEWVDNKHIDPSDVLWLIQELETVRNILKQVRREHLIVDSDCWFSCPASGKCCRDDGMTGCDCGADAINKLIDEALQSPKEPK